MPRKRRPSYWKYTIDHRNPPDVKVVGIKDDKPVYEKITWFNSGVIECVKWCTWHLEVDEIIIRKIGMRVYDIELNPYKLSKYRRD